MRTPQETGTKGSLKWIQVLINEHSDLINAQINDAVKWVSPIQADDFAEYRDGAFLDILGLSAYRWKLREFWPRSGPQWDALGRSGNTIYLVEAKANIPEIESACGAKSPKSITKITAALDATRHFLNVESGNGWLDRFYQHANRLAHLYFLREICSLNVEMIFVYFCNDHTYKPTSEDEWLQAITEQKKCMGFGHIEHVSNVFINVDVLERI